MRPQLARSKVRSRHPTGPDHRVPLLRRHHEALPHDLKAWSSAGTVHVPPPSLQWGRYKGSQAGGVRVPQLAPRQFNKSRVATKRCLFRIGNLMRIHLGCELRFEFPQPTPMILTLNVHFSRVSELERPDYLITNPPVAVEGYRDSFGNWCSRLVAPCGHFSLGTDAIIRDWHVGPDRSESSAAPSAGLAGGGYTVFARQPLLRDRSSRRRGLAPLRKHAAWLAASAGHLRLCTQSRNIRLRTFPCNQNGI